MRIIPPTCEQYFPVQEIHAAQGIVHMHILHAFLHEENASEVSCATKNITYPEKNSTRIVFEITVTQFELSELICKNDPILSVFA